MNRIRFSSRPIAVEFFAGAGGLSLGLEQARFELVPAVSLWENAGYLITRPVSTLNAANFGVPQIRERLFVLGIRSDAGQAARYPQGPAIGQPARPTVDQAISDLPPLSAHPELLERD